MMEKPASTSSDSSLELQCVGRLNIVKPKPVGFLCGSIPVPTDEAFHASFNSALVPSNQKVRAPRYRVLPNETDLNTPPFLSCIPDKIIPVAAAHSRTNGDLTWENGAITSNLSRKGEALAVSGFVDYGDDIDVIGPADILKQIFKIPYSKARLSVAVHRVGQTLVLNTGPDLEEGEKLVRRHKDQSKHGDPSLLSNFAMHSVRMEACDCPPTHHASVEEQFKPSVSPGQFDHTDASSQTAEHPVPDHGPPFFSWNHEIAHERTLNPEYSQLKKDDLFWGAKSNKKNKGRHADKRGSEIKEKSRSSMQEPEIFRRYSDEGFLRVLFWQFHNFRMLLGSDLLLFSNEKYVSVSLHLWDVSRQVTQLTWLEAWLDNVMASVPELAICYHRDGVVQGYELLKTDDIFLLKGVSDDGTPAFNPHVVQQKGLSVLSFLQENCKQDPGAYWLYKNAGEDVIQLFDLSVIPKKHSPSNCGGNSGSLPSLIIRGRSDSILSLGTLLYRIAHRLSLSLSPDKRARSASFFRRCIDFLDEPDHLVVRAFAHEQFARFLLNYEEELDSTTEALPIESGVMVAETEEESFDFFDSTSGSIVRNMVYSPVADDDPNKDNEDYGDSGLEASRKVNMVHNVAASRKLCGSGETEVGCFEADPSSEEKNFAVLEMPKSSAHVVHSVPDPISSKLAAINHVSQAIKSLRWKRRLQSCNLEIANKRKNRDKSISTENFSVCACGDNECIEVCDIREWLPTVKLDDQLWKLILLLGESYLALGQAYKDNGQLHQALKIVELASLLYGSMPKHLEETRFISSMVGIFPYQFELNRGDKGEHFNATKVNSYSCDCLAAEQFASSYLFWAKAWTLVGDVYVEFYLLKGKEKVSQAEGKPISRELRMSSEVLKEVKRLKKKLGRLNENCISCSLVNCSCRSDRASSGNSASSSTGSSRPFISGKKQSKRSVRNSSYSLPCHPGDDRSCVKVDGGSSKNEPLKKHEINCDTQSKIESGESSIVRSGGIFKYLDPVSADLEYYLSAALCCYEEVRRALGGHLCSSAELQSVLKKRGWICNEMGRRKLERKEMEKAELAFADAINSFREVSDHINIILIYCNLGHGRRALAEEMVSKSETVRKHAVFHNVYTRAVESAKLEYCESLKYYGAAKMELNYTVEEGDSALDSLRSEVFTQYAHTYLRLGMFLAREDTAAEVYEKVPLETCSNPGVKTMKDHRKHEVSANEAIREALSLYESLGNLRKQEAAYAYFQLACYQRDCCLKFLESNQENNLPRSDSNTQQRAKQYASLAERNWQKSLHFYGPKTHPTMFLTLIIERSALLMSLSDSNRSYMILESAISHMLEGRLVSEKTVSESLEDEFSNVSGKFWSQLRMLLKKMLAMALTASSSRSSLNSQQSLPGRSGDVGKLRELYKMSLKSTELGQLNTMHHLWTS